MFVYVEDKKVEIEKDSNGLTLAEKLKLTSPKDAIAMTVNDTTLDLHHILKEGDKVKFGIQMQFFDGTRASNQTVLVNGTSKLVSELVGL